MSLEDNNIETVIAKLSSKVNDMTKSIPLTEIEHVESELKNSSVQIENKPFLRNFKFKLGSNSNLILYITIPLVIATLLYIWKPKFIKEETVDMNTGETIEKLSMNKYIVFTVIVGGVLSTGLYGFFYKKP